MTPRSFIVWRMLKSDHGNSSWCVHDSIVTVVTQYGNKSTQVGGSNPEFIAYLLTRELANECRDCA